jgi:hypothetical protein
MSTFSSATSGFLRRSSKNDVTDALAQQMPEAHLAQMGKPLDHTNSDCERNVGLPDK